MSLEGLPNKLKLWLMKVAPDVATLSALIHASPTYHAVYLSAREECLAKATICDLESRGIDVLTPHTFIEVSIRGNRHFNPVLKQAIEHCYRATQNNQTTKLKLSLRECRALVTLTDLVGWDVQWEPEPVRGVYERSIYPPASSSGQSTTHAHQHEVPRWADDYRFPFGNYKFIAFDPNRYPVTKPAGSP